MKLEDNREVMECVDDLGFEETFGEESDWSIVADKKFHTLISAYTKAYNDLKKYIGYDDYYKEIDPMYGEEK